MLAFIWSQKLRHKNFVLLFKKICYPLLLICFATELTQLIYEHYYENLCILSGDIELHPGPQNEIQICHLNIRSLSHAKLLALKHQLANVYDIIAITETFLNANSAQDLSIQEYHPILRKDRAAPGGGVAVYISQNYIYKRRVDLEIAHVECLWVEIISKNQKFLLAVCYRPPDANAEFWEDIQYMIDLASLDRCKNIIMTGDLNADPLTLEGRKLSRLCDANDFTLHIDQPTRITENSSTILDQFISNIPQHITSSNVLAPLSTNDHCTITMSLSFKKQKSCAYKRLIWLYDRGNFEEMNTKIKNYDWNICFDSNDIDIVCQNWTTSFLNLARQSIPNKLVEIRPKDTAWYNSELRKLKRSKDRAHNKAKTSQNMEHWANFRLLRNQYTNKLRDAERTYRESLALTLKTSKNIDPKRWWHVSKQFMGKSKDTNIPPMEGNNKTYFDTKNKADAFNEAFLQFSQLNTDGAVLPTFVYKTNSRLSNINILESDVCDILKSLDVSKATGPDGISARMLKETALSSASSLTRLLRKSFEIGKIPKSWKIANVLPLHKKGDRTCFSNYRPISLLSVVSKVYEKLIFKHVFNYLRDNNLISIHQSGFIPGDSTVNQLLYMYNLFCCALNEKKDVRIVFCDQSKAFDRVWHEGILFKLKSLGIEGQLLKWFSDYLKGRKQRVIINGICSELLSILAGVPQGSVLGPLLFLIYINDLTENVQCGIKLFADDTSLYIIFDKDNVNEATEELNSDLQTVSDWANQWLVTFNPQKTKSLYISLRNNPDPPHLLFDGHVLDSIESHRHLGLELNSKLGWKDHIESITTNSNKKLNLLAHLKHLLDRKTLLTMYQSFIRPSLEYGNIIFCNCTDLENEMLESVQRRAARIISGGIISTSSTSLYQEIAIEPLKTRRNRNVLLMFHKIINDNTPPYLTELKPRTVSQRQDYNLRNPNNFTMPLCRISKYQKSFLPYAIYLWNQLTTEKKKLHDYDAFKEALQRDIPIENTLYEIGTRRETIIMARLRMNCSELRAYLYHIKVIDSPQCTCGYESEDTVHFFISCPLYNGPRTALLNTITNLTPFTLKTVLYGNKDLSFEDNKTIYLATLNFVRATKRFDPP